MATLVLLLLIVAGVIGLGMARVPLAIWAAAVGLLTLVWRSGVLDGEPSEAGLMSVIAWAPHRPSLSEPP